MPAHPRLLQHTRKMLHELGTTIEYGRILWDYLCRTIYDYKKTSQRFTRPSIAEQKIISIAHCVAIRNQLNSLTDTGHPFGRIIDFYSAPIPSYTLSGSTVKQQILEYQRNPTKSKGKVYRITMRPYDAKKITLFSDPSTGIISSRPFSTSQP